MATGLSTTITDPERLAALRSYQMLDTPAEEAFDRYTRLATTMLRAPIALVSLVDGDRQFFKSCVGLPEPYSSHRQTPLSHSFCQYTVDRAQPLVVTDARLDPLLKDNLAIPDLNVIAYAGMPLITSRGYVLGSLCVIDSRPRVWTASEQAILADLAAAVVTEIELRGELLVRDQIETEREAAFVAEQNARERLDFVHQATLLLTSSLDDASILQQIGELIVPHLADYCLIFGPLEGGQDGVILAIHRDPDLQSVLQSYGQLLADGTPPDLLGFVRAGSEGVLIEDASCHAGVEAVDNWVSGLQAALSPQSYLLVPLVVDRRHLGTLLMATSTSKRLYTTSHLAMAEELAVSAALALGNGRLYRERGQAIRERDALIAIASHELKNPLTALLGYAGLLRHRLERRDQLLPQDGKVIDNMVGQVNTMTSLLDQLLDLRQEQDGTPRQQKEPVDVRGVAEQAIDECQRTTETHRLLLQGTPESVFIKGDASRLGQAFHNLLGNAIKYSPTGGDIVVTVTRDDGWVRISVSDAGIGIPASAIPHLFERFYRVNLHETGVSGYGIGLYVVQHIVSDHGGNISVTSAEGAGSTFVIKFPAARPD
ncbi:MAG: ATP-binding protein [Herpetosiphon sp.]